MSVLQKDEFNLIDYHIHPYSHGEINLTEKKLKEFVNKARKKGLIEIGFSDHDQFLDQIDWNLLKNCQKNSSLPVKLGLEIDYRPGREEVIKGILNKYELDYCIGSVHFIDQWNFDHPDYIQEYKKGDIDKLYEKYFSLVNQAVSSNLFDIIGHFDLIKIFNFYPDTYDLEKLVKPVLKEIKKRDLVVEINTNGLNKPVQEIYPSLEIIKMMKKLNILITTGSDAHSEDRVGENIFKILQMLRKTGYKEITSFNKRKKQKIKIKN